MTRLKVLFIYVLIVLIFSSFGCEAFRKKFIRKPKYKPKEEVMVIVPKDYSKLQLPVDKAYIQYYTYWKAWHNEVLNFLVAGESKKKIVSCFDQTILNLNRMKDLLENGEKIKLLDDYIARISSLEQELKTKAYIMFSLDQLRNKLELLSRNIQREFSFSKVKNDLKWE